MEVLVRLLQEPGKLLGFAGLEIGVHEPDAKLQVVLLAMGERFEDGDRFGEAVLAAQVFDEPRLPSIIEHLAAMGVEQDLDRPGIVIERRVQVLGDVLAGGAGLLVLGPDLLSRAGHVGLFLAPIVVPAFGIQRAVPLLPRFEVAAELLEHDRQERLLHLAQVLDLGPPLTERVAVLAPAVLVVQPEPIGLGIDPLDKELQAVARPGDLVQGVGRFGDHRRVVVRLPLEHAGQEVEGEMAEVVGHAGPPPLSQSAREICRSRARAILPLPCGRFAISRLTRR